MLIAARSAEYVIVQAAVPGRGVENIGVLLLDPENNLPYLRFRRDWESLCDQADVEYLRELPDDLAAKGQEFGGEQLIRWIEDTFSNFLLVSERDSVLVEDYQQAAERLYKKHVKPKVLPFRTHLPLYSLQAAAGKFGENMEVEEEGWVEAPERLRLTDDMFVAHVTGRSMEPMIPDGSLCIFRYNVTGSRQGKLVLVMNYGETGENRFTVKRYTSRKVKNAEGWQHSQIRLEPLNPEYEAWDLDPEDESCLKIVGEFVAILSSAGQEPQIPL